MNVFKLIWKKIMSFIDLAKNKILKRADIDETTLLMPDLTDPYKAVTMEEANTYYSSVTVDSSAYRLKDAYKTDGDNYDAKRLVTNDLWENGSITLSTYKYSFIGDGPASFNSYLGHSEGYTLYNNANVFGNSGYYKYLTTGDITDSSSTSDNVVNITSFSFSVSSDSESFSGWPSSGKIRITYGYPMYFYYKSDFCSITFRFDPVTNDWGYGVELDFQQEQNQELGSVYTFSANSTKLKELSFYVYEFIVRSKESDQKTYVTKQSSQACEVYITGVNNINLEMEII